MWELDSMDEGSYRRVLEVQGGGMLRRPQGMQGGLGMDRGKL